MKFLDLGFNFKNDRNSFKNDVDLCDLLRKEVIVVRDIIYSTLKNGSEYYYMKKDPKKVIFDILNAEILLIEDLVNKGERKELTKSMNSNIFILSIIVSCRINNLSIYDFIDGMLEFLEVYANDRIYCEKSSSKIRHLKKIGIQLMSSEYKFTYEDLGNLFDINKGTACQYKNSFYKTEDEAYIETYEEIAERINLDVVEVRQCLGNKAYMENSKGGTYTVFDMNEPESSPLRKREVSKSEMTVIMEEFFETVGERSMEVKLNK